MRLTDLRRHRRGLQCSQGTTRWTSSDIVMRERVGWSGGWDGGQACFGGWAGWQNGGTAGRSTGWQATPSSEPIASLAYQFVPRHVSFSALFAWGAAVSLHSMHAGQLMSGVEKSELGRIIDSFSPTARHTCLSLSRVTSAMSRIVNVDSSVMKSHVAEDVCKKSAASGYKKRRISILEMPPTHVQTPHQPYPTIVHVLEACYPSSPPKLSRGIIVHPKYPSIPTSTRTPVADRRSRYSSAWTDRREAA